MLKYDIHAVHMNALRVELPVLNSICLLKTIDLRCIVRLHLSDHVLIAVCSLVNLYRQLCCKHWWSAASFKLACTYCFAVTQIVLSAGALATFQTNSHLSQACGQPTSLSAKNVFRVHLTMMSFWLSWTTLTRSIGKHNML